MSRSFSASYSFFSFHLAFFIASPYSQDLSSKVLHLHPSDTFSFYLPFHSSFLLFFLFYFSHFIFTSIYQQISLTPPQLFFSFILFFYFLFFLTEQILTPCHTILLAATTTNIYSHSQTQTYTHIYIETKRHKTQIHLYTYAYNIHIDSHTIKQQKKIDSIHKLQGSFKKFQASLRIKSHSSTERARESLYSVVANVEDWNIAVREFELQPR